MCTTMARDKRLSEYFSELYAKNQTNGYFLESGSEFLNRQRFLSMLTQEHKRPIPFDFLSVELNPQARTKVSGSFG